MAEIGIKMFTWENEKDWIRKLGWNDENISNGKKMRKKDGIKKWENKNVKW